METQLPQYFRMEHTPYGTKRTLGYIEDNCIRWVELSFYKSKRIWDTSKFRGKQHIYLNQAGKRTTQQQMYSSAVIYQYN